MSDRRVLLALGVTYQTPFTLLEKIPTIIQQIITELASTRFDQAHFKEYGEFALIFEFVYFVLSPDYNLYMDSQEKINLEIFRRFEQERIEFAYPTRTLIRASETTKREYKNQV